MARITVYKPNTIVFSYKPQTQKEYSECMWADFMLDLDRYDMIIRSDCGNYQYTGWSPTPETESFLHLCQRFEKGYLLEKFSRRTRFDLEATIESLKEYLSYGMLELADISEEKAKQLFKDLRDACEKDNEIRAMADNIEDVLDDYNLKGHYEDYEIFTCIEYDYPIGIKTVIDIYLSQIVPKIREYEKANREEL